MSLTPPITLWFYGIFLLLNGVVLVIAPGFALPLVGLEFTGDQWVRIVGVLAFEIGCYFVHAARNKITSFYVVSVYGRIGVAVAFLILVLSGQVPIQLLLFATVDALSALCTSWALRREHST